MEVAALERCVGDVARFLDRHWGREPLLWRSSVEPGFDDLASLDDLDHMVSSLGLSASSLRMVRRGTTLPAARYTTSPGKRARTSEPLVSAPLVYARFSEGATIVLESLHRYWRPLTDFCRDLELTLGHRLQVNAYITPPGSQGFDVHRDDHDVFVMQVWGAKHWIVYDRDHPDAVLIDEEIERGSVLYIPTGFPHAATTGSSASAHLTVGILTHGSGDVVREIAKLAEKEPAFQERLPPGVAGDPVALRAVVEHHVEELRGWLDKLDVDELTRRVARRVSSTAQPIVHGQLRQLVRLDELDLDTVVARRRGSTCLLYPRDDALTVFLADRELEMPRAGEEAMRRIAGLDRFRVGDLHDLLTPESSLVLVRRLIREGLLEVVLEG
ncbi:MAG: JmjC domain-containing protein [Actinomycetota bacterium]